MPNRCIKEGKKMQWKTWIFSYRWKVPEIKNKRHISRSEGTNHPWKESSDTSQVKNLYGSRNQRLPDNEYQKTEQQYLQHPERKEERSPYLLPIQRKGDRHTWLRAQDLKEGSTHDPLMGDRIKHLMDLMIKPNQPRTNAVRSWGTGQATAKPWPWWYTWNWDWEQWEAGLTN